MAYTIRFRPSATRSMRKLPRSVQVRLKPRIDALAENPRPPGVDKLAGEENAYRIRVGDYRIIYEVRDIVLVVVVMRIGHRREVYR